MEDNPLDLEFHEEDDTVFSVVKRRIMFVVLIGLCVAMAAPSFGSCESALGGRDEGMAGEFTVDGEMFRVSRQEFQKARLRLWSAHAILSGGRDADDKDPAVWSYLMLDAAARKAGIHIPPQEIGRRLVKQGSLARAFIAPDGQVDAQRYAEYVRSAAGNAVSVDTATQALGELMRGTEYVQLYLPAMRTTTEQDAFDTWRKDNPKLGVTYAAVPFADHEAEVEGQSPTDDELALIQQDPSLRGTFQVASRKRIEAAYLHVRSIDDALATKLRDFATAEGLLDDADPAMDLDLKAFELYHRDRERVFTESRWLAARESGIAPWLTGAGSEEDDGGETERVYPDNDEQRFDEFWGPWARREWLARAAVERLARAAEQQQLSLAEAASKAPFADLGIQVVSNEELLADDEFAERFPEGLAVDTEFSILLRGELAGPAEGEAFLPKVRNTAIGTTNLMTQLGDRGSMVLRLADWQAARPMTMDEIKEREDVLDAWRRWKVRGMVEKRLSALVESIEGGKSMEDAVAEAGLELRTLPGFRSDASRPTPPTADPGEELSPELATLAARIRHRNRVVDRYRELLRLNPGELLEPPPLDSAAEAGLLIRVDSKTPPTVREMGTQEMSVQMQRQALTNRRAVVESLSFEALSDRFALRIIPETPVESDPESSTGTE